MRERERDQYGLLKSDDVEGFETRRRVRRAQSGGGEVNKNGDRNFLGDAVYEERQQPVYQWPQLSHPTLPAPPPHSN